MDAKSDQSSLWGDFIRLLLTLKLNKLKLFNAALLREKFSPKMATDIVALIEWAEGAELVEKTRYSHKESGDFYRVAKLGIFIERAVCGAMYEEEEGGRLRRTMTSCGPLTYQRAVRWVANRNDSFVFRGDDLKSKPRPGGMPIYGRLLRQYILDELASIGLIKEISRRGGQITYALRRDKLLTCLEAVSYVAKAYLTALRWLAEHLAFTYCPQCPDKEDRGGPTLFGPLTERHFLRQAADAGIVRESAEGDELSYRVDLARLERLLDPASDAEAVFSRPLPAIFALCQEVARDEVAAAATPTAEPAPEQETVEPSQDGEEEDKGEGEEDETAGGEEAPEPAETGDESDWHLVVLRAIQRLAGRATGRSVHELLAREKHEVSNPQVSLAIREMVTWGWLETRYQDARPFLALTGDGLEAKAAADDKPNERLNPATTTKEEERKEGTMPPVRKVRVESKRRLIWLQDACGGVGRRATFRSRDHLASVLGLGHPAGCTILLDNAREAGVLTFRSPGPGGGDWTVEFAKDTRQMWPDAATALAPASESPAASAPAPEAPAAEPVAERAAAAADSGAREEYEALQARVAELEEALLRQAAVRIAAILDDLPPDLRQRALDRATGVEQAKEE